MGIAWPDPISITLSNYFCLFIVSIYSYDIYLRFLQIEMNMKNNHSLILFIIIICWDSLKKACTVRKYVL